MRWFTKFATKNVMRTNSVHGFLFLSSLYIGGENGLQFPKPVSIIAFAAEMAELVDAYV